MPNTGTVAWGNTHSIQEGDPAGVHKVFFCFFLFHLMINTTVMAEDVVYGIQERKRTIHDRGARAVKKW